jgi:hypothetical protein
MRRSLTLALAVVLVAGAPALAASVGHGPAVSAGGHRHKPCSQSHRRGCWIQVSSFQFGVALANTAPTHGGSGREAGVPSVGEIKVTKPKPKRR